MAYIAIHAEKDPITEKNDEIKNSKEKRKWSAKKWPSEEVLLSLFIFLEKSKLHKNIEKNIVKSITYEDDLVKFSYGNL